MSTPGGCRPGGSAPEGIEEGPRRNVTYPPQVQTKRSLGNLFRSPRTAETLERSFGRMELHIALSMWRSWSQRSITGASASRGSGDTSASSLSYADRATKWP